jgi:hypothetical protein
MNWCADNKGWTMYNAGCQDKGVAGPNGAYRSLDHHFESQETLMGEPVSVFRYKYYRN